MGLRAPGVSLGGLVGGVLAATTHGAAPIRSGQGDFVYEYQPQLLQVPPSPASGGVNVLNGHAVTTDSAGNIYLTFQPANVAADTQCLARWAPDGTNGVLLGERGPAGLSQGVPHGLELEHDAQAQRDYLYHANNDALLFKTSTEGAVIWSKNLSSWKTTHPHFWPCKPTDAMVVGETLYVADGYGTSWIHMFSKHNGTYISSFGGSGKTSADPVKFRTPHSISADQRFPGDPPPHARPAAAAARFCLIGQPRACRQPAGDGSIEQAARLHGPRRPLQVRTGRVQRGPACPRLQRPSLQLALHDRRQGGGRRDRLVAGVRPRRGGVRRCAALDQLLQQRLRKIATPSRFVWCPSR